MSAEAVIAGLCITHLSEVSRMVFVHVDSVVVLSSSITTTSWMFPVLANTSVTSTDVTPLFPVLVQVCTAGKNISVWSPLPVWTVRFTNEK